MDSTSTTAAVPDHIRAQIEREDTVYLGPVIIQAPSAWCRAGATWYVPSTACWIVYGPGLARWGTSQGLAQLASASDACNPKYHATAWCIVPAPNLCFAIEEGQLEHLGPIRDAVAAVSELIP